MATIARPATGFPAHATFVGGTIAQNFSLKNVGSFLNSYRMSAWALGDASAWLARALPNFKAVNLSAIGRATGAVEAYCDGPHEAISHAYKFQKASSARNRATTQAARHKHAYTMLREGLAGTASTMKTLTLAHKAGVFDLGSHASQVSLVAKSASLVKATTESVEKGRKMVSLLTRPVLEGAEQRRSRDIGKTFFDLVIKASSIALKIIGISGILVGFAVNPVVTLSLSTVMLTSFLANHLLAPEAADEHAADAE